MDNHENAVTDINEPNIKSSIEQEEITIKD